MRDPCPCSRRFAAVYAFIHFACCVCNSGDMKAVYASRMLHGCMLIALAFASLFCVHAHLAVENGIPYAGAAVKPLVEMS